MKFSFLELVQFTGVVQGIFLMFCLQFASQKNKDANKILMIIIGLATFMFAGKIITFHLNNNWIWRVSLLADCTIYLFGPLLYLYFRRLVFKHDPKNTLSLLHYIPALLLFLYFGYTLGIPMKEYFAKKNHATLFYVYLLMEVAAVTSLITYTFLSYKIVKHIKKTDNPVVSLKHKLASYITYILIGIGLMIVCWIISIIKIYGLHSYDTLITYKLLWICMTIFLFIVGYFSFTQPEIIRLPVEKKTAQKDRLRKDEIEKIKQKLNQLIEEEEIYIRSDLSLKLLAKKVETSANNLSWLLNSVYGKTFYEFVNEFRVKAFLSKIKEGEHKKQTILAIAMDSGFNSKSTFNKSFKMIMNDTPSRYIEKNFS